MPPIQLYAELLLNIRTVTIIAALDTNHTLETKATLAADGQTVTFDHNKHKARIVLPTRISSRDSPFILALPAPSPSRELALRLRFDERSPGLSDLAQRSAENDVPWSASDLDGQSRVCCIACGNSLLSDDGARLWKDLPNEFWAEMMEFWHCHKPHDDEEHDHGHDHDSKAGQTKGYAAGNRWRAIQGTGFVDLCSFVFHMQDCDGIKMSASPTSQENISLPSSLHCKSCDANIGVVDEGADGWRIFKWNLNVEKASRPKTLPPSPIPKEAELQKWISAQLLAHIENQGTRKFIIKDASRIEDDREKQLLIWVFTPDLSFSSAASTSSLNPDTDNNSNSPYHESQPIRALKIFWRHVPIVENSRTTSPSQPRPQGDDMSAPEELALAMPLYASLELALDQSAAVILPESARRFQGWNVGLLRRF